jgi:thiamine pyrophosphate-dependent acetolactate synthase large subunit-like protein
VLEGTVTEHEAHLQPTLKTTDAPIPPKEEQITAIADLLQESWAINRPLILAGRGALDAGAAPALKRLGALTGALMATTLHANALFHGDPYNIGICGTYSTPVASELIPRTDCVLVFGAGLNSLTTYKNTMFPKAMIIQVDTDPNAFGRFTDVELAVLADTRLTAEKLLAELERRAHQSEGFRTPEVREAIAEFRASAGVQDKSTAGLIDPRTLMVELDRMLPPERILCSDGGQQARFAIRYVSVNQERNFLQASDAGAIGLGMGLAIGAAVSRPDELVMAAIGDASMMMALGDLETAVRLELPILIVVSNDEALGSEVNFLSEQGLSTDVALTPSPSFAAIAEAMGARSATVRSAGDLKVVEEWLRNRPRIPLLLDCRINPEVRAHFV